MMEKSKDNFAMTSGCTANIALIYNDELIVANVGDSRTIVFSGERDTIEMSHDHKPNDPIERERIYLAGGYCFNLIKKNFTIII